MIVSQILKQKPDGAVHTVPSSTSIEDAIKELSDKRIGALMVSDDASSVSGILSERDVVLALNAKGTAVMRMSVADLMTTDVVACAPDSSAVEILEKMTEGRFRHMPVVDQGTMVGVISIGDVVKARITEVENENSALTDMIVGDAW